MPPLSSIHYMTHTLNKQCKNREINSKPQMNQRKVHCMSDMYSFIQSPGVGLLYISEFLYNSHIYIYKYSFISIYICSICLFSTFCTTFHYTISFLQRLLAQFWFYGLTRCPMLRPSPTGQPRSPSL